MSNYSQFLPPAADAPIPPGAIAYIFNQAQPGATTTDSGACVRDNAVYLQADYPDLYAMVGLVNATHMIPKTTTTTTLINSGVYGAGYYLFGLASNSGALRTTDFVTWTQTASGLINAGTQAIAYENSLFVAGGGSGGLITSTDAVTWSTRISGTASSINGITYGAGLYVLVGAGGMIRTSTDAITWAAATSGTTTAFNEVIYQGSQFVAGGVNGILYTSTDAVTWTSRSIGVAATITGITYGAGLYMIGITNGVKTSTDAVTWSATNGTAGAGITAAYGSAQGLFVTTGVTSQKFAYSTDGVTFVQSVSGTTAQFTGLIYGNGIYAGWTGTGGTVYVSADPTTPQYSPNYSVATEFYVPKIGTLTTITAAVQNVYVRAT